MMTKTQVDEIQWSVTKQLVGKEYTPDSDDVESGKGRNKPWVFKEQDLVWLLDTA